MAVLGGVILALWYSLSYLEPTSEYRLGKHGYPMGAGKAVRAEAQAAIRAKRARRYAEIYRHQPEE